MKILFVFALLTNIIIFLWEYNKGTEYVQLDREFSMEQPKQILLLAEVDAQKNIGSMDINVHRIYELSELMIPKEAVLLPTTVVSNQNEGKKSNLLNKKMTDLSLKKAVDLKVPELIDQKTGNGFTSNKKLIKARNNKQQSIEFKFLKKNSAQLATKSSELSLLNAKDINKKVAVGPIVEKPRARTEMQDIDNLKARNDKQQKADEIKTKKICYQLGPFVTARSVNRWRKRNKINKDSLHLISKDRAINKRYLVYFPAAKTFSESVDNVQMLKQKGISDYWLIRKGASRGAISLGFFSREQGAQALQKRLFNKGIKVYIKQKHNKKAVFFVQISSNDERFKQTLSITKNQRFSSCTDD